MLTDRLSRVICSSKLHGGAEFVQTVRVNQCIKLGQMEIRLSHVVPRASPPHGSIKALLLVQAVSVGGKSLA